VPGEANPGHADLSADAAEGTRNPRRGVPVRQDRGGHPRQNLERAAKPEGAAGVGSSELTSDGRTAEDLVVVETNEEGAVNQ
jgi:hypothetical protein